MTIKIGTKGNDKIGPDFYAESVTIKGRRGDDVLAGGNASDKLVGGKGADVLIGGAEADLFKGGKGKDIFVVSDGDTILDFQSGKDLVIIDQDFEKLYNDGLGGLYADFEGNASPGLPADLIVSTPGILLNGADLLNV